MFTAIDTIGRDAMHCVSTTIIRLVMNTMFYVSATIIRSVMNAMHCVSTTKIRSVLNTYITFRPRSVSRFSNPEYRTNSMQGLSGRTQFFP